MFESGQEFDWGSLLTSDVVWTGLLLPLLLLFIGRVRQWLVTNIVTPIRGLFSARADLKVEFTRLVESLRDEISTTISEHFARFHQENKELRTAVTTRFTVIDARRHLNADEDPAHGTLECDHEGAVVWASRSMTQWMSASREDFYGARWLDFVVPAERANVRREFGLAREEHRVLRLTANMGPHGESNRQYYIVMSPLPDRKPALEWLIRFRPVGIDPRDISA